MIDSTNSEYKLLQKQLYAIKNKTSDLFTSYELFLGKIKDICCVDDSIFYSSELIEISNKFKYINSNLGKIISSINSKI